MAAPSKKRAPASDVDDLVNQSDEVDINGDDVGDDQEADDDMEGQEFINQEIQVEFEARNLEDSDFHGVRKLFSQLFLKANIDLSELTNTLISQNYVGSAIKQVDDLEDDDDDTMETDSDDDGQVFGVISVINITERKNLNCVKQLKSVLLEKCAKCGQRDKLASILNSDAHQVGFIINERFINIPAQLAVPSFDSLWNEVEKAKRKQMKYDFSHYLMIAKVCKMSVTNVRGSNSISTFVNAEEELFAEAASVRCEYSVASERDTMVGGAWDDEEDPMEPYRVVMVIPADRIPDITPKMKEAYG